MKTDRMTRVNELLRREIGDMLYKIVHESDADLSAITITHVVTSTNLRNARVLVSIRGSDEVRQRLLRLLKRHRAEFQREISRHLQLKYTPCLSFDLDSSLEEGDHMLRLLSELDTGPADKDGDENVAAESSEGA